MTRILQVRDDIFFVVVGHTSPDVVLKKDSNTLFTGYVKNEIPYINMADVCVAPLTIGGGTRIKILNYMACGKPVIATPVGTEGLDVQDGESVLIANIDAFYGKLLFLLTNPAKKEEMGLHARKTVESLYSWKLIADNLVTHLRSCITNSKEYD
jgi:glycosyltransferase involved in cell wall biosynthesis